MVGDYSKLFEIADRKRSIFTPIKSDGSRLGDINSRIQNSIGRVTIMSDCAHDLGARRKIKDEWRCCGNIADFTNFSFHAVKNFTTAEGGAATWRSITGVNDSEIYAIYQLLSLHGQSKDALAKTKAGAWEYDIVMPAYKCNMTDIMAAIGLAQLQRYPQLLDRRKQIVKKYDEMCNNLGLSYLVHNTPFMNSSAHLYLVRIPGIYEAARNKIIEKMAAMGVSTNVHYKPLPMMTAYKRLGWNIEDFPNAYDYYRNVITLPLHTLLTDSDVDYICKAFESSLEGIWK